MAALKYSVVIGGPLDVNTYVVYGDDPGICVLIDPGAEPELVSRAVGERTVSAVLLTHGHFDHMLYASPWLEKGARLYIHMEDAPMLNSSRLNLSGIVGQALKLPAPDGFLEDGQILKLNGCEFRIIHTPGHTAGSVSLLCGGVLFSGDTMFYHSYGRTDFPGGSDEAMLHSLSVLKQLDPQTDVCPGHGPATRIDWER